MSLCLNITNSKAKPTGALFSESGTDTTSGNNKPTFKIYDRFGKEYSFEDIKRGSPTARTVNNSCTINYFHLDFTDNVNEGFNDPIDGEARQAVVCKVFEDISELIIPAKDPSTGLDPVINIEVMPQTAGDGLATDVLGAASAFYVMYGDESGFFDGEIWKTINSGIHSYSNLSAIGYTSEDYYHGTLQINFINFTDWYYDYTLPLLNDRHDLYTVVLHEVFHALGFTSFLTSTGVSGWAPTNPNAYSRFDKFLETISGTSLITNSDNCFNTLFNVTQTELNTLCDNQYSGSTIQPIYSPISYEKGINFNHFDKDCSGLLYLMISRIGIGIERRQPLQEEVSVLCDLGYNITGIWRGSSVFTACGSDKRIADVNDFYLYGTGNRYTVQQGSSITINDFLSNDEYAGNSPSVPTNSDCIEKVIGAGEVVNVTGTSFRYKSSPCEVGEVTIKYIPLGANGERGNVTYIYIFVSAPFPPCGSNSCNLVCGGDLESVNNQYCHPLNDFLLAKEGNSPDLFQNNYYFQCPIDLSETTLYVGCDGPVTIPGSNNFTSGQKYVGFGAYEGIFFELKQNLIAGAKYNISYYARNKLNSCKHIVNIYGSENRPCRPPQFIDISTPITNCDDATTFTPILLSQKEINNDTKWEKFEEIITAPPGSQIGYIIVAPPFNPLSPNAYVFLDDVMLTYSPCAGSDKTICKGFGVQIGEIPITGFSYSWSPTFGLNDAKISNPIANPKVTTTYTLTATETSTGNIWTSSITVFVNPTASFSFNPYDNVEDLEVTFINNSTYSPNTSFTWDFMDGTQITNNSGNVNHVFSIPGYYEVTLTLSNTCGVSVAKKIIYIIPNYGIIVPSECFSIPPEGLANFNFDYIKERISGNITWNSSVPIYIKDTLTIEAGGYLKVTNTTVVFGPQGRVIVDRGTKTKPGGILELNGSTFTGFTYNHCQDPVMGGGGPWGISSGGIKSVKMMWQGIEVLGYLKEKATFPFPFSIKQGRIILNNSTIEDAYNGVILGKLFMSRSQYVNDKLEFRWNPSYFGSVIQATNSTFNRCARSIYFLPYPIYSQNYSIIKSCKFLCKKDGNNSRLTDLYFIETPDHSGDEYFSEKFRAHNPFVPLICRNAQVAGCYSLGYNNSGRSVVSIENIGNQSVEIALNTFENANAFINSVVAYTDLSKGPNTFTNSNVGVYIQGDNPKLQNNKVVGNQFTDINLTGILMAGITYPKLTENIFNRSDQGSQIGTGILMHYSKNFTIADNIIKNHSTGIWVANSGTTRSDINYKALGNTFTKCILPILTSQKNDMLNMKCNNFDNTGNLNFSVNWLIKNGTLADQGLPGNTVKDPAGNQFKFRTPLRNQIDAHVADPTDPIAYYHHKDVESTPAKYYSYSTITFIPNDKDFPVSNPASACLPATGGIICASCTLEVINSMREKVDSLKEEHANVKNHLDKGRTSELLETIRKYTPANTLKEKMLGSSPLSDAVLEALLKRGIPLPPQVLKEIMIPNSPVSKQIHPMLEEKYASLPPFITEEIKKVQVENYPYRTLTLIQREINKTEAEKQRIMNEAVYSYLEKDSIENAITLLEPEKNKETKQTLVGTYIDLQKYDRAENILSSIPLETQEDIDFYELNTLRIELGKNEKMIWDMDSTQIQKVRAIASRCPLSVATVSAQGVLRMITEEIIAPCETSNPNANARIFYNNDESKDSTVFINKNMEDASENYFLEQNIPNPLSKSASITYNIPGGMKGEIIFYNFQGSVIQTNTKLYGSGVLEINMEKMKPGIYFYTLKVNDETKWVKKFVFFK